MHNKIIGAYEDKILKQQKKHDKKIEMRHAMEMAKNIQIGLFPAQFPNYIDVGSNTVKISGITKPKEELDGDFFNVIPLGNNKVFLVLGGCCGKRYSCSSFYGAN